MSTFAKSTFNALTYATFRPTYPPQIFKTVLAYHASSPNPKQHTLLDLGCGHGLISRSLSPNFTRVIGTDPSSKMIAQAISSTPHSNESEDGNVEPAKYSNIEFKQASAEDLWFVKDGELDMAVAGQAAHWFDYSRVWGELSRTVRKGGTVAFWGYKDNVFVDYPRATRILDKYCYGKDKMGPFWEQPGRGILRNLLRDIVPPESEWEDVQRVEYEPNLEGEGKGKGRGEVLMQRRLRLGEVEGYVRTFSAYWNWMEAHPEEKSRGEGGEGDVVDEMFDEMRAVEPEWREKGEGWRDVEVDNEWGSVILMARRK
ncbi:putative Trans-aconitate 3-methyltransferase [Cadophora sp. MPI-SDFR-AT-0126]|nr:putative Trans-aconitate 3-methyltransferase [Leotiomycetes sp. MPI-SDFR-AT-0126]